MNYQKLILVGNAGQDAQRRKSKKGDVAYTIFSVGISDAKKRTTFFQVATFGKLSETSAKYIKKGSQVLVEGRLQIAENRCSVIADRIAFGVPGGKPAQIEKQLSKESDFKKQASSH
jgi:single stranded DNA-binding protein